MQSSKLTSLRLDRKTRFGSCIGDWSLITWKCQIMIVYSAKQRIKKERWEWERERERNSEGKVIVSLTVSSALKNHCAVKYNLFPVDLKNSTILPM